MFITTRIEFLEPSSMQEIADTDIIIIIIIIQIEHGNRRVIRPGTYYNNYALFTSNKLYACAMFCNRPPFELSSPV